MAQRRASAPDPEPTHSRAASTPAGRENQLIGLAVDLAERQLREGTASAQVISHYLKASSSREYLEQQRLAMEIEVMEAKKNQMAQADRMEVLVQDAIDAMRGYQGHRSTDNREGYDA